MINEKNNNLNFLYNKALEKDSSQFLNNKMSTLNKQNKQNHENNNLSLKCESPNRYKNDIIDRIINENKGKFYEYDTPSNEKTNLFNKDARFKVNEKDFEFFDNNSEKKNAGGARKKYLKEDNIEKNLKGDFESRRRNKINEITEKDDIESYENNKYVGNDYKKNSGNNNNFNYNEKKNNGYKFQKY